jgi:pimeloyl-ACP methyl ester carboxylesterase
MSNLRESYAQLADGRPIYFFEEGAGEPFLYVHMSTGRAENAEGMIGILRDRFHCIALDRAGYHRSGALDRLTTMEEQVAAIAAVHDACTAEPAWVFGHSGGGTWSIAYALAHPDRVRGLILYEPALYGVFPPEGRPPGVAAMIERVAPLFRAGRLHEAVSSFEQAAHPELSPAAADECAATYLASDWRAGWEAFVTEMSVVVTWSPMPEQWAQLTQPALVMTGDCTVEALPEIAARVAEMLPHGELAILEGQDHGAPLGAPDVVAQRTVEFIDRVLEDK